MARRRRQLALGALPALLLAACEEQGVGALDPTLVLAPSPFTALLLEVDAAEGLDLDAAARDRAVADFAALVDKPVGWAAEAPLQGVEAPDGGWTGDELVALADDSFFGDEYPSDDESSGDGAIFHVQVLVLPGAWGEDPTDALAVSWGHRHVAVFGEQIAAVCESWTGQGKVEEACEETWRAVLLHELGHVIGLVDDGLPMVEDHEDPEHPGHDIDEECVMNASVQGARILDQLRGSIEDRDPPLDYDAACRADVDAVRHGE